MTRRSLKVAAGAGTLLALLLLLAWLWRADRGPRAVTGDLPVAGLSAPVEVVRDDFGIPHVWASSPADAWFAQGYLHASDRLWQMEEFRRIAAGRLSELFGEPAVETDRFLRTVGIGRAAERGLDGLCAACRRTLDAYVAGVNAAIEGWSGPLPPEFLVLRTRPAPWTPTDALALEKIMAWDLAAYDVGLLLEDARSRGGPRVLEAVRPRYPTDGVTIVPGADPSPAGLPSPAGPPSRGAGPSPAAGPASGTVGAAAWTALLAGARIPPFARGFIERASALSASNAWVVGGARSRSGKPLVASDMHLALKAPTLFYLMGLHAPGLDVVGVTLPGSPGVIAGRSGAVAWGFSNAMVDDVDFFIERADPVDATRYLTPDGSAPFAVREEEITVRGRDAPLRMRVRETRHGPVVSDVDARAGEAMLALRWAGHDPSPTLEAILGMNTAASAAEFVTALRGFRDPHLNVVFADTAGAFGYWMAGRIPLRRGGRPALLPVPGWTGEGDWVGDVPFDEHPHLMNPAQGFVVTANNRQTAGPLSDLITSGGWGPTYRAERITELIQATPLHDAATMRALQMDVVSPFARRLQTRAATAFREAGETARADSLDAWDGAMTAGRREPMLFYAWLGLVRFRQARELYGGAPGYFPTEALERMFEEGAVSPAITTGVVREAVANASAWNWGSGHTLELDHPLGRVRGIGDALGFGRGGMPLGGGPYTINLADHTGRVPPFPVRYGVSQRHVVDLADADGAAFILPGGQSGYPRGAHAFDQLPLWLDGDLATLPLTRGAVQERAETRFRLVPR